MGTLPDRGDLPRTMMQIVARRRRWLNLSGDENKNFMKSRIRCNWKQRERREAA